MVFLRLATSTPRPVGRPSSLPSWVDPPVGWDSLRSIFVLGIVGVGSTTSFCIFFRFGRPSPYHKLVFGILVACRVGLLFCISFRLGRPAMSCVCFMVFGSCILCSHIILILLPYLCYRYIRIYSCSSPPRPPVALPFSWPGPSRPFSLSLVTAHCSRDNYR